MEARDNFFREAYQKHEDERSEWEKEVAEEYEKNNDTDLFDELISKCENYEIKNSNSVILDSIINTYLKYESNEIIKKKVRECWIGSWDSPCFKNANVQTVPYYDNSHLVKITTELQIELRRVCELFSTAFLFYLTLSKSVPDLTVEHVAKLSFIQLNDIKNDTDHFVEQIYQLIPDSAINLYNIAFKTVYMAGLSFVIFHEIGHILEIDDVIARLYGLIPSHYKGSIKNCMQAEENADKIGIHTIKKLFSADEAIRWMAVSGVLIVFITLALNNHSITSDTTHPALSNRLRESKNQMLLLIDKNEERLVDFHIDFVCDLLQKENLWKEQDWWKL